MSGQLSLTEQLAARLARPIDAAARARARLHLLDWLGCVAGAWCGDVGQVAARATVDPVRRAALLGSVLEMDDVDRLGRVHPGPVAWSAALMEARHRGASLGALLEAGVRGTEAAVVVARMLDDRHYAHCHPTHTAGRFGAAAAAASVAGLGAGATAHALAIAGSSAGAYWRVRHEPATSKAFHVADAVLGGVFAVDLATAGMTGPLGVLEGAQGLFDALCDAPGPLPNGPGWLMFELSFKPHAACRHAHAAIDAALALRARGVAAEAIEVRTYADAVRFCDRPAPRTPAEARFSLQHAVAVAMVRGTAGLEDFTEDAIHDPAVAAVRAQVGVREDAALSAAYPAHFGAAVTAAGETEARADALGDPEVPMDADAVAAKADALLAHGGMKRRTREKLIARVLTDDEDADTPAFLCRKLKRL